MAGKWTNCDYEVSVALTCKYMGWDWETYCRQPRFFIEIVDMLRKEEALEAERENERLNTN